MINACLVAVDVKHPKAKKEYTYLIPKDMQSSINLGDVVRVPFANMKTTGVVTELLDTSSCEPAAYKLKSIIDKEPVSLPAELLELAKSLSKYYGTPLIDFLRLMLPPSLGYKTERVYFLQSNADNSKISKRAFNQKQIFDYIAKAECATESEISKNLKIPLSSVRSALTALCKKEIIKKDYKIVRRKPFSISYSSSSQDIILTEEQEKAIKTIVESYYNSKKTVLLYGVTGSGKTEVYLRAIDEVIKTGKKVLMLVPEISLTPQMLSIFQNRFKDKTAVIHSKLSAGERFDEWQRICSGKALVTLGARSAIFAPIQDLGMIIIDEEHETSYKNGEHPYYDARMVAQLRAKQQNALLVLGSATPSVESFYRACKGEYLLAELTKRVSGRHLPKLEVIDMREELKAGNRHIFSRKLLHGMKETLEQKKQVILFLNRRGHSTFVICRDCGFVLKCKYCDISMTYHFEDKTARCHYCGYTIKAPDICPKCSSRNIRYFGAGTEKVEEEARRFFPQYSTIRIDSDSTRKKGSLEKMLASFKKGNAQILVGTQSIAKGLDFPNVTLVGIISADTILNVPDFRSGERTFQLITQVAGRSGRGETRGKVYVQTYNPESFAIQAACNFDIEGFYKEELKNRKEANYPPFCRMLNIVFKGNDENLVKKEADKIGKILQQQFSTKIKMYGPVPAPRSKIRENYRYNILIKSDQIDILINICNQMNILNIDNKIDISWDIDPLDLL